MVVMGHLHPSITLRDEMKIKNEKYKCFLVGRYNKKDFVIVPSFLNLTEGVAANEIDEMMDNSFSIIPNNELDNFEIFIVQEPEKKALDFGRLRDLE
jgi:metallophosphoesterase superfamily enzyme